MKFEKQRIKEIDENMKVLEALMAKALELGDLDRYRELQEAYSYYLDMKLRIDGDKKDRTANRINVGKIVLEFLVGLGSILVAALGISVSVDSDRNNKFLNQRSFNIGLDQLKRKK